MILNFALIILGIALLVWAADRFTDGAAAVARNFGVSPMIIGLTIIAIGSSAPEIIVSIVAAFNGEPELAIGNALGSNITNIAFVVGITAFILPLQVESKVIKREFPILFLVTITAGLLMSDLQLTTFDGIVLLVTLVIYIAWLITIGIQSSKAKEQDRMIEELVDELPDSMSNQKAAGLIVIGAILLGISSQILVYGATQIAREFGVSELIIGLTIVALGTSLPELAASVAGVLKNDHEMAIGNIIGSNIFNLLAVLGIPGIIASTQLESTVVYRDFLVMFALTVALFLMAYGLRGPGRINRLEGGVLAAAYVGYLILLYFQEVPKSQQPEKQYSQAYSTLFSEPANRIYNG
ncbi:MAG: calcium/sodium antiporter [Pseudomonadota bacterium]